MSKKVRSPRTTIIKRSIKTIEDLTRVEHEVSVDTPIIRHSYEIISLATDDKNRLTEIHFNYKGVLVIPKFLKKSWKASSAEVQANYCIPSTLKHPILDKDYRHLGKKETTTFLAMHLREEYVTGLKELLYKEITPEIKIIDELPWK